MSHRLALYTFGVFIEPAEHPSNDGFHARNNGVLSAIEQAAGIIARSGYLGDPGPRSWGAEVYPRFYEERGDGWSPAMLSLWVDLESPMAAAYFGIHGEALSHGREWFRKPQWPPYVLWWVDAGHRPTWQEAVVRHQRLHDHGPSPAAFNFKQPFDADGHEASIDRARVKALAARNAAALTPA